MKKRFWVILSIGLVCISVGTFLFFHYSFNPIPKSIRSFANFPLYYPKQLPAGYYIKPASFQAREGAVIFEAHTATGDVIYISEQSLPNGFDFNAFYESNLISMKTVALPIGTATVGVIRQTSFASLPLDKTWIILHATSTLPQSELTAVLSALRLET